jgi:hypothetical protein
VPLRLGIDIACRAAHQASLADEQGRFLWTGRRFRTTPADLAGLWAMLPAGVDPADLRAYYAKHTKSDRLDSQLLARLPMLHPDGLHLEQSLGPGEALKRAAKLHSTLTHRRTQCLARLDALLEILGPAWHAAVGSELGSRTVLKFLAAGYADPHVVKRSAGPGWPSSAGGIPAAPGANRWPAPCWAPRPKHSIYEKAATWTTPT